MSPVVSELTLHAVCLCFKFRHLTKQISTLHNIVTLINVLSIGYFIHLLLLLLQHGDTESNPAPKNKQVNSLFYCGWNVNSLLVQNMSKISQNEAYNSLYSHDSICISETYSDSTILEGDKSFHLNVYNLLRADHSNSAKQGGVCIYYKESQGVREVKLSTQVNVLFVKSPCKTVKDVLVLSTGPQAKKVLNFKISI